MTPSEIRALTTKLVASSNPTLEPQTELLGEIAAQLAEMNLRLARYFKQFPETEK